MARELPEWARELPALLTPDELRDLTRKPTRGAIYQMNYRRSGPPPQHVGGRILYRRDDVLRWLDGQASSNQRTD
jgi:hypothetical protein